eukprot:scaffold10384_cov54-Phaeocystis_antarctica.AAC.3
MAARGGRGLLGRACSEDCRAVDGRQGCGARREHEQGPLRVVLGGGAREGRQGGEELRRGGGVPRRRSVGEHEAPLPPGVKARVSHPSASASRHAATPPKSSPSSDPLSGRRARAASVAASAGGTTAASQDSTRSVCGGKGQRAWEGFGFGFGSRLGLGLGLGAPGWQRRVAGQPRHHLVAHDATRCRGRTERAARAPRTARDAFPLAHLVRTTHLLRRASASLRCSRLRLSAPRPHTWLGFGFGLGLGFGFGLGLGSRPRAPTPPPRGRVPQRVAP